MLSLAAYGVLGAVLGIMGCALVESWRVRRLTGRLTAERSIRRAVEARKPPEPACPFAGHVYHVAIADGAPVGVGETREVAQRASSELYRGGPLEVIQCVDLRALRGHDNVTLVGSNNTLHLPEVGKLQITGEYNVVKSRWIGDVGRIDGVKVESGDASAWEEG